MFFGDNHKAAFKQEPVANSNPGQQRGELRMSEDFFTTVAGDAPVAAGEVILMQRIPQGARIVDVELFQALSGVDAQGNPLNPNGAVVDVGWTDSIEGEPLSGSAVGFVAEVANPTGFITGADLSSLGSRQSIKDGATIDEGFGKKFGSDVFLSLTVTADSAGLPSQFGVRVFYVED